MTKNTITVLLADDDSNDHTRFKQALSGASRSLKINSVYNGMQLINYVQSISGKKGKFVLPDLIITDLYMPFAGGLQVLKKLRQIESFSKIPIYVFSSNYDSNVRAKVIESGATDFFKKPSKYNDLVKIIAGIVNCNSEVVAAELTR